MLKREHFSRIQLKILDWMIWLIRRIDHLLPWPGVSLIAVARRPLGEPVPRGAVPPPVGASLPGQDLAGAAQPAGHALPEQA